MKINFNVFLATPRGTSPRSRIPTPRVSSASNRSLISYSEEDVDGVEDPEEDLHEMVFKSVHLVQLRGP